LIELNPRYSKGHMSSASGLLRAGIALVLCSAMAGQLAQAQDTAAAPSSPAPDSHWAFLDHYCTNCHNASDWAGGVAFDTLSPTEIGANAETFEKAVRKLRGRFMPPAGKPQPDPAATRSFVGFLEARLDTAALHNPDPGVVALHRLNRKEYANAVRDLLAVDVDPVALLPKDDTADGFDNVASALQVTPSFLDQYLSAARTVAVRAMGNPQARASGTQYAARNAGTQQSYNEGLPLGTRGGFKVEHFFPADAEYVINIANMAQALWVYNLEFENTVVITLDGAEIYRTTIGGEDDTKAIDQKQDPAVDAINKRLKNIRFKASVGQHEVAVAFVRRTFAESDDRLQNFNPGGGQERVLRVASFEIKGPFNVTGLSDSASRRKIFVCHPTTVADEEPCARTIVLTLAQRAYRRPLTDKEMQDLMTFYKNGREGADFDAGIRYAITAILASPGFLYRAELPAATSAGTIKTSDLQPVSDLDLASRLSFFLWSTVPDDELLRVATQGQLHDPAVIAREVTRMLADPRAQTLTTNFAFQWLNVPRLSEIEPDARIFGREGDEREDFRTELQLFIDSIFRSDASVLDLLSANYTYVNERLALFYGMDDVRGGRFRRVSLPGTARNGLLGKGAVLMLTSYPTRTAPVLRGKFVLESLMGTPPAAPPANVPSLKENEAGKKALSVRERMEMHRAKPACFACHGVMDPLGLALENFDAVGKYRDIDRETHLPINSSGKLPDGTQINGPDDLRKALLAHPEQFVQALTMHLMTYAVGRTIEYYDMPTVRAITRACAQDNYRFSCLATQVATSDAFRFRRPASPQNSTLVTQTAKPE
jgi:Protein of unknown function (DUF1592)/Protein of unknown function (DUF1588)/Protein of unknown function (DUF1587)/Protein of unknown function (DUF1585)/Protein of unknown function (DUF1595)